MVSNVKIKIIIVEDDVEARETLLEVLNRKEYSIKGFGVAEDAFEYIQENAVDLVISDLVLPGRFDGIALLEKIKAKYPSLQVIMVTGHATVDTAIKAMKQGAYDYLTKPIDIGRLRILVEKAMEHRLSELESNALASAISQGKGFQGMFGTSEKFLAIIRRINLVAPTESNVLVLGESGTGKELTADAIHNLSQRKDGPFVKVNLNAIPESLIESELFGHVRGAFTGADRNRKGKFQQANGGTILLDEIGDMPYNLQAKLLRVIENKKVTPVGSEKDEDLSMRIIASTNRDLHKLIDEGQFRSDLFFRLSAFTIKLPPLRERKEDIPILADHFIQEINKKLDKNIAGISKDAMKALESYSWPGNIRQLASAIDEMALLSENKILEKPPAYVEAETKEDEATEIKIEGPVSLSEMEKEAILSAMDKTGGNKKKAAEILGIGLRTLYRKLKKYDLEDL
ncbi:MAG: sigma-54-dependent transcriptional regulator [Candidatus Zixiibacteriota bacterium]